MLVRSQINFEQATLRADAEKGTFEGYAARFGSKGVDGITVMRGAFDYTLRKFGKPRMFFNHSWSMPIGRYKKVAEDEAGLFVAGEFTPGLTLSADVRAAMLHSTIDALSTGGFIDRKDQKDDGEGGMIVTRWTRLVEISPVVFGGDDTARIDLASVRSEFFGDDLEAAIAEVESIRDCERILRDAGFSRGLATALVSRFKAVLQGDPAETADELALRELKQRLEVLAKRELVLG